MVSGCMTTLLRFAADEILFCEEELYAGVLLITQESVRVLRFRSNS